MSDIDGLLTHCYDLLLQRSTASKRDGQQPAADDALCVCAKLIERSEA